MDLEELGYTQVERNRLGYSLFRARLGSFSSSKRFMPTQPCKLRDAKRWQGRHRLWLCEARQRRYRGRLPRHYQPSPTSGMMSKMRCEDWAFVTSKVNLHTTSMKSGATSSAHPFYPRAHSTSRILASTRMFSSMCPNFLRPTSPHLSPPVRWYLSTEWLLDITAISAKSAVTLSLAPYSKSTRGSWNQAKR